MLHCHSIVINNVENSGHKKIISNVHFKYIDSFKACATTIISKDVSKCRQLSPDVFEVMFDMVKWLFFLIEILSFIPSINGMSNRYLSNEPPVKSDYTEKT